MPFDLDAVRAQFPALNIEDGGRRRIYLDNPAGTQVPRSVAQAMSDCLLRTNANIGGYFPSSMAAAGLDDGARDAMADLLNASSSSEIIFGQNMTTITLHLSRSIGRLCRAGDEIILSRMDHDANVWPWVLLARDLNLEIRWLSFSPETFEFDLDEFDNLLTDRTRLVCVGGASNLTGTLNDIATICAKARAAGALSFIDAVQSVPHVATDVQEINCDFLVCSPYKFFGPHQGVLWGRRDVLEQLEPYKVRPAPDALPDCFETGTQSHEGFAGVKATVDYFEWIGTRMAGASAGREALRAAMDMLFDYEKSLASHLIAGLKSIDGVNVQGISAADAMDRRVPTVSFTHTTAAPAHIAESLAQRNIFVWHGHNYAVEAAKTLGIYESGGAVRVGPVHYNSMEELDELLAALPQIFAS